jgi:hypothetical protein
LEGARRLPVWALFPLVAAPAFLQWRVLPLQSEQVLWEQELE